ncbi:MAG: hypothetical protein J5I93_25055 [Pirellulaceae bacterium]|nr:hypothetical protein [Pirellulaceae bacterium]
MALQLRGRRPLAGWLALVLVCGCGLVTGRLTAQEGPGGSEAASRLTPIDTSWLRAIEERLLPEVIVPGPAAHADLSAYYTAANPALLERFAAARKLYEAPRLRSVRRLTLVAGDAGVGKSFLKREAFGKNDPAGAVCKLDIRELYQEWLAAGLTEARPDLRDGDVVLNRLLAVKDRDRPLVSDYLAARPAAIYVIDSLDEIHPDDHGWFFDQLEQFVFSGQRDFRHVVVFSRPLAFHQRWQPLAERHERGEVELHWLHPPRLRTTGDLLVSTWNYLGYRHKLRWRPEGGDELVPMSLQDFTGWSQAGFHRSGSYSSVTLDDESPYTTQVHATMLDWTQRHRVLIAPLWNLAGNSLLRETIERRLRQDSEPAFDERTWMLDFLHAWLRRDTQSDDRPSLAKPEYLALYVELLERVAVRYARPDLVDDQGFFQVAPEDRIELTRAGRQLSFSVERILNRSGMKHLELGGRDVARYRFEPIWFHRLLVEMHNDRLRFPSVTRTGGGLP